MTTLYIILEMNTSYVSRNYLMRPFSKAETRRSLLWLTLILNFVVFDRNEEFGEAKK
jgi:hypothetical protein